MVLRLVPELARDTVREQAEFSDRVRFLRFLLAGLRGSTLGDLFLVILMGEKETWWLEVSLSLSTNCTLCPVVHLSCPA